MDIVIGVRGPIAPPEMCNGLLIPMVVLDQMYSFDVDALIKSIPKPEKAPAKEFAPTAEELFLRIVQMADNARSDRRSPCAELSGGALSGHLCQGCGAIRVEHVTHGGEGPARHH